MGGGGVVVETDTQVVPDGVSAELDDRRSGLIGRAREHSGNSVRRLGRALHCFDRGCGDRDGVNHVHQTQSCLTSGPAAHRPVRKWGQSNRVWTAACAPVGGHGSIPAWRTTPAIRHLAPTAIYLRSARADTGQAATTGGEDDARDRTRNGPETATSGTGRGAQPGCAAARWAADVWNGAARGYRRRGGQVRPDCADLARGGQLRGGLRDGGGPGEHVVLRGRPPGRARARWPCICSSLSRRSR